MTSGAQTLERGERALFFGSNFGQGPEMVSPFLERHVADQLSGRSGVLKGRRKATGEHEDAGNGTDSLGWSKEKAKGESNGNM